MAIANYGQLRSAIQLWIDRDDDEVVSRIPLFINMAEKEIYRELRMPAYEVTVTVTRNVDKSYSIPRDMVRLKYMTDASKNLWYQQISYPHWFGLRSGKKTTRAYPEQYFARRGGAYFLFPETEEAVELTYWRDVPEMTLDADSNVLLMIAPDLYIYQACKHAANYIGDSQRSIEFAQLADVAYQGVVRQVEEDELGGSSIAIPYVEERY